MNRPDANTLGKYGEETAAGYLEGRGYRIIHRNLRIGHAEIDLVAENDRYLLFAEVKTRRQTPNAASPFGTPSKAVNERKREMLTGAAEEYLRLNGCEKLFRIDVIEVYADPYSDTYRVLDLRHFENVVQKTGKFSRKRQRQEKQY